MEWLKQLEVFGPAAAGVIFLAISALIYQTKKLTAEQEAHHKTRDVAAQALQAVNDRTTQALLANTAATVQQTELLRLLAKSSQ